MNLEILIPSILVLLAVGVLLMRPTSVPTLTFVPPRSTRPSPRIRREVRRGRVNPPAQPSVICKIPSFPGPRYAVTRPEVELGEDWEAHP